MKGRGSAGPMLVVIAALLFAVARSAETEVTLALAAMVPLAAAPTRTTTVNVATPPEGNELMPQPTLPVPPTAGFVEVQPAAGVTDSNVVFAGTANVSWAFEAACGPALRTVIVYVSNPLV